MANERSSTVQGQQEETPPRRDFLTTVARLGQQFRARIEREENRRFPRRFDKRMNEAFREAGLPD
jgi:hypothetical protein